MFTVLAIVLGLFLAWRAERGNLKDRAAVTLLTDDEVKTAILHARQDLKLVAFLLGGILAMLGIIADRVG